MATLSVDYDSLTRRAQLSVDALDDSWDHIRRIVEDATGDVAYTDNKSLSLPWWYFLSTRPRIAEAVEIHGLTVRFTESAKHAIQSSLVNEGKYEDGQKQVSVEPSALKEALLKVKFIRAPDLKTYQLRNIAKLIRFDATATFSVPGAGKTTEALAFYSLKRSVNTRLLVVAPKNAFAVWEEQWEQCFGKTKESFTRLTGGLSNIEKTLRTDKPELSIISYHQVARDGVKEVIADYLASNDSIVFLDESHKIKRGEAGKIGSVLLSFSHIPRCKLVMSGTPLPNSIDDLIPQFLFLYPEFSVDDSNVAQLIKPIYVRTTKTELGLKSPIVRVITLEMSPTQRHLYDLFRKEKVRDSILDPATIRGLRAIGNNAIRLLQLTCNPALLLDSDDPVIKSLLGQVLLEGTSPKLEYACEKARLLARDNKKSLIWTSFVDNVEIIASRLEDLGAVYIHGRVNVGEEDEIDTREEKIRRFHDDPNTRVLVANPAAAAESISLHKVCHYAIYVDRTYNAAQFLQSQDRIHRIGLPEDVDTCIDILCMRNSIDESVERRLDAKIQLMATVLDDPSLRVEYVREDIDDDVTQISTDDAEDLLAHMKGER